MGKNEYLLGGGRQQKPLEAGYCHLSLHHIPVAGLSLGGAVAFISWHHLLFYEATP